MARTLYELQLEAYGGPGHVPGSGGYRTYVAHETTEHRRAREQEEALRRPAARPLSLTCYTCPDQIERNRQARLLYERVQASWAAIDALRTQAGRS